jgi:hypothetical protein
MKVVSANIKDNPDLSPAQVVHDTKVVAKMGGIIGWQEIGEREDHRAIDRACPPRSWFQEFDNLDIPISAKKRYWTVEKKGYIKTHNGKAATSPSRYVTWVVLGRKGKKSSIAIVNTHFVSGAWNNKPKTNKKWRQEMWQVHWKKEQEVIADLLSQGISVIGTGDFNRVKVEKFFPRQVWCVGGTTGIDKIFYINATNGVRLSKKGAGKYTGRVFTDHRPCWAEILMK